MKKFLVLLLAAALCLSAAGCSRRGTAEDPPAVSPASEQAAPPAAPESARQIRVEVTNAAQGTIVGVGITWRLGEQAVGSTGVQAFGQSAVEFVLEQETLPRDADLGQFGVTFRAQAPDGAECDICTLYFPASFGSRYAFEVRNMDGGYAVWDVGDGSLHTCAPDGPAGVAPQSCADLTGPWHLDGTRNDLAAFADLFPGYAEWDAGMEIRSDGRMSWYIGAEGWHGTCTAEGASLHAALISDLDQTAKDWDFRAAAENGACLLEMPYEDITVYWIRGEEEGANEYE